jgi:hypothetical protein
MYYPPAGYPPPGYPSSPGPRTSPNAIVALVLGIIALTGCGLAGIPAVVLGYRARREIRESAGQQEGDGLALAGVVLGWIGVALTAVLVVGFAALIAFGIAFSEPVDECYAYDANGDYREFADC